ncbi:MAG: ubiquinone-dependent pyruvate dehydrogenase [Thermoplasmata archaeon]
MTQRTAAELLVATLEACGVRRIYGITGDSLNAVADAIRRHPQFEWIHTRHEEAAAFAASAEAHLTGTLAVCAGSCGPGNLHLINGLYDAHRSRVPVLAIAAQIPSTEIGSEYFQETHPERVFREASAFAEVVSSAAHLPRLLDRAIRTAVGRRDVAVVVLPGDVSWQTTDAEVPEVWKPDPSGKDAPSADELSHLAAALNGAARVTIFAGAGCADAHAELLQLATRLRAPIVHTLRGKESVEPDNPFDVGLTGLLGSPAGYHAMEDADLVLLLGTSFPYRQFYPEQATIVQVDRRPEEIGRRSHVELGIVADVRLALTAVLPLIAPRSDNAHLERALDRYAKVGSDYAELAIEVPGAKRIHPQLVARLLNELAPADAIFSADVGTPTVWAARYLKFNGRRRLVGSFNHGSMANALPHAIGAQAAFPGRTVVALAGDGGLSMLMGELLTLRQQSLPVKVVVFNNGSLGFVELEMVSAGLLPTATDLVPTDFARIAEAAGLTGIRVEQPEAVRPALERAFATAGPVVVDVAVHRLELITPPKISWAEASGFALFFAKAMLGGREGDVIDLAESKLFR